MKIALKSCDGHFACAENGGQGEVVINRIQARGWEMFEVIEYPDHNIALIACNNCAVTAMYGGGANLVTSCPRDRIQGWELFKVHKVWAGGIALRSCNGQYICADNGGGGRLIANRNSISAWSIFDVIAIDDGPIPNVFDVGSGLWTPSWLPDLPTVLKWTLEATGDNTPEQYRHKEERQRAREARELERRGQQVDQRREDTDWAGTVA